MLVIDILMVFGPVLGYIPQYNLIKQTKSLGSFSIDVCGILIIANIIRIFFWFAHGYAFPLFLQSILMIFAQLMLLRVCIEAMKSSDEDNDNDMKELTMIQGSEEFSLFDFWRWNRFRHYLTFLAGFTLTLAIITWGFTQHIKDQYFGQILGFISMTIEATLGLPQLYKNHCTKSVAGLSFILVMTWFFGDFSKTIYYIIQMQPIPFIMCGTIQLVIDILIILQIVAYKKNIQPMQLKTDERLP